MLLRILILLSCIIPAVTGARPAPYPIWLYPDDVWQRSQNMHLQTQQQLQMQDQYRRNLLMQDQERQLRRLIDEQRNLESLQRSNIMRQHVDQLRSYSRMAKPSPSPKKPNKK